MPLKVPFKINFQNTYFENTIFYEKHMVPTKMVWLKGGVSKGSPLPKLVIIVCLENHINRMFILKVKNSSLILSSHNQES